MAEGEDGELDAELVADRGVHGASLARVPIPVVRAADPPTGELLAGFTAIRQELGVPPAFPPEVDRAAQAAAAHAAVVDRTDRRDLELRTLDPPGSSDLDQAFTVEPRPHGGWRVWYAIADVAAFVVAGDAIDVEARSRGATLYSPDLRTPLHPNVLGEGAASLLPGEDRPALLWCFDLDDTGAVVGDARVTRAVVRSRSAHDYPTVQRALDDGSADATFVRLREVGLARQRQEQARGGVSLNLPEQIVKHTDDGYRLAHRAPLAVEGWNAQLSLLTGMAAASLMVDGGVGLLRTLPPPEPHLLDRLHRSAASLGVPWPAGAPYGDLLHAIDASTAKGAALLQQAARVLRGAGYVAFDGAAPTERTHAAVAAPYAHVTAPLRRLADRFANEVVVALSSGDRVPAWARDPLADLPKPMARGLGRSRALAGAIVDFVEAMALRDRLGERFDADVVDVGSDGVLVQVHDPPVVAPLEGPSHPALGSGIEVVLAEADPGRRRVRFSVASA
jgi:exoribonuclease R